MGPWAALVSPILFICQNSAVAELLLAWPCSWEPSQWKQLILFQNRALHINKCLVTDAFFSLLALLSSFSCPSFNIPLAGKQAGSFES